MLDPSLLNGYALLFRPTPHVLTHPRTAGIKLGSTCLALDEKAIAAFVGTVGVLVTALSALMAMGYDMIGDSLSHPLIKHKVLAEELELEAFLSRLPSIINNTAMQLVDVLKAVVLEPGTRLLATNTTGAVEQNLPILLVCEPLENLRECLTKGIGIWQDRALEMSNLTLVMIAHIDNDRTGLYHRRVEFTCIEVGTDIRDVESVVAQTISYKFRSDFDLELGKGGIAFFQCDLERDLRKDTANMVLEGLEVFRRD